MNGIVFAALLCTWGGFATAQTSDFSYTGQIRTVIAEKESRPKSRKSWEAASGLKFSDVVGSKDGFYFSYSTSRNSIANEKWIALPDDRDWSELSNRSVRLSGLSKNGRLSIAAATPLAAVSPDSLTGPSPTRGIYKVVAALSVFSRRQLGKGQGRNERPKVQRQRQYAMSFSMLLTRSTNFIRKRHTQGSVLPAFITRR